MTKPNPNARYRKPATDEARRNLSEAAKRRWASATPEERKAHGAPHVGKSYAKGRVRSLEERQKQSESIAGEKHHQWKGDEASYNALHFWARTHFEDPKACEFCGESKKRLQWAAKVSGVHTRNREDWLRLCQRCHARYDAQPWSEETRRRYQERGPQPGPNLGRKWTPEQREKIRQGMLRYNAQKNAS